MCVTYIPRPAVLPSFFISIPPKPPAQDVTLLREVQSWLLVHLPASSSSFSCWLLCLLLKHLGWLISSRYANYSHCPGLVPNKLTFRLTLFEALSSSILAADKFRCILECPETLPVSLPWHSSSLPLTLYPRPPC